MNIHSHPHPPGTKSKYFDTQDSTYDVINMTQPSDIPLQERIHQPQRGVKRAANISHLSSLGIGVCIETIKALITSRVFPGMMHGRVVGNVHNSVIKMNFLYWKVVRANFVENYKDNSNLFGVPHCRSYTLSVLYSIFMKWSNIKLKTTIKTISKLGFVSFLGMEVIQNRIYFHISAN